MSNTPTSVVTSSAELSVASTSTSVYITSKRIHLGNAIEFLSDVSSRMLFDVQRAVVSQAQFPRQEMFTSPWASSLHSPDQAAYPAPAGDAKWAIPPLAIHGLAATDYVLHLPFLVRVQYAAALAFYPNMTFVRGTEFLRKMCIVVSAIRAGVYRFLGATPLVYDEASRSLYTVDGASIWQNHARKTPTPSELIHTRNRAQCGSLSAMEYSAASMLAAAAPNVLEYSALLSTGATADLVLAHTLKWMKGSLMRSMSSWQVRAVGLDNDEIFEVAIASATIGLSREYLTTCMYMDHFLPALRMSGMYSASVRDSAKRDFDDAIADLNAGYEETAGAFQPPTAADLVPIEPPAAVVAESPEEVMNDLAAEARAKVQQDFAALFSALPNKGSSVRAADADSQA